MRRFEKILSLLLIFLGVTLFSACSNDKDEPQMPTSKVSSYTVTSDFNLAQLIGDPSISGTIDLTFYEYNDRDEIINYQEWENVKDGSTKKFTASKLAKKLTVFIKITAISGTQEVTLKKYSAQVYYLQEGSNINIRLDGNTRVSSYSPI